MFGDVIDIVSSSNSSSVSGGGGGTSSSCSISSVVVLVLSTGDETTNNVCGGGGVLRGATLAENLGDGDDGKNDDDDGLTFATDELTLWRRASADVPSLLLLLLLLLLSPQLKMVPPLPPLPSVSLSNGELSCRRMSSDDEFEVSSLSFSALVVACSGETAEVWYSLLMLLPF